MNTPQQAAQAVADSLASLEASLDSTIADSGEALKTLARARPAAGLSLTYAPEIFEITNGVIGALVTARSQTAALHNRLEAVKRKLRLEVSASGPVGKPDAMPAFGPLALVPAPSEQEAA